MQSIISVFITVVAQQLRFSDYDWKVVSSNPRTVGGIAGSLFKSMTLYLSQVVNETALWLSDFYFETSGTHLVKH